MGNLYSEECASVVSARVVYIRGPFCGHTLSDSRQRDSRKSELA
jgi:hypothetical protein